MAHGQHAQPPQFLGCVEDNWWEPTGHLGVQANLYPSLDFVLALHKKVQKLLGVHDSLTEVGHQAN